LTSSVAGADAPETTGEPTQHISSLVLFFQHVEHVGMQCILTGIPICSTSWKHECQLNHSHVIGMYSSMLNELKFQFDQQVGIQYVQYDEKQSVG
jgi:hypothetical protein